MRSPLPKPFALLVFAFAPLLIAQQPASQQPLQAMPYLPSLDVNNLDRAVDPCTNFYQYACGGWQKHNPIPADQAGWDVYSKLANDNQQFLWGILLEDASATSRTPIQQKVGDYFAACMNTSAIDSLGVKPVAPALARIDALKTRPQLLAALTTLDRSTMGSFFWRAGTGQDAVDASTIIVDVGAGGLGLPDRDYYLKPDPKSVKIREQYVAYIEQLLQLAGEPATQAQSDAAATLKIETALAKASLTRVERRDPHKTYHFMPIADLEKLTPSVDWPALFAADGAPVSRSLTSRNPSS